MMQIKKPEIDTGEVKDYKQSIQYGMLFAGLAIAAIACSIVSYRCFRKAMKVKATNNKKHKASKSKRRSK